MAQVLLGGNPVTLKGTFPNKGEVLKEFKLSNAELKTVGLADYSGKRKVLNIFPSVDTPTCAASVRKFNELASSMNNTVVLNVSADLPFAQARFCASHGLKDVHNLSNFRNHSFLSSIGLEIAEGPFAGLAARAVVVLNEKNEVVHAELVSEIANEPNYESALKALN